MFKIIFILRDKFSKIAKSSYFICLLFLVIVVLLLDVVIYIFEVPVDNTINSFSDIIWWNVVTLTTVGYGDMYPTTLAGKLATILIMLSGIATLAYLLSGLVEYVVDVNQKKELGLLRVKMDNHIVICNWNERAEDLINQLKVYEGDYENIVIIDNQLEQRPLKDIEFVKGSPSDVQTLKKAGITKAKKAVILARGQDKSSADASTVLTSLAIRSLNQKIFICAEILDTNNVVFLKNAQVDEIIDINTIISRFIAQTAYDHKLLRVLNELVSNDKKSCEIYRVKLPRELKEKLYSDIVKNLKENYDCLPIALENSEKDYLIMNPEYNKSYDADYCFVISEDKPEFA